MTHFDQAFPEQHQLQNMLRPAGQGMVVLNQHHLVVGANHAAEVITGMDWEPGRTFERAHLLPQGQGKDVVYTRWDGLCHFTVEERLLDGNLCVVVFEPLPDLPSR